MRIVLFLLVMIASIVSQLPMLVDSSIGNIMKACWLIPLAVSVFDFNSVKTNGVVGFVFFLLVFSLYCMIMESATGRQYMGVDLRNIAISCLIFVTSYMSFNSIRPHLLRTIPICLLLVGVFMSVFLSITYNLIDSIQSSLYVYQAKNSTATILASIIVIAIFLYKPIKKFEKIFQVALTFVILVVVMLLRSRATILGLVFAILYYVFSLNNKTLKRVALLLLMAIVVAVLFIPSLNVIVVDQILYAGREVSDANEFSSGRVEYFPEMFKRISNHPYFGNGNMYFDCMPLVVLAQYGILGASIIFIFLTVVFIKLFRNRRSNDIYHTAFVLYCVFLINSLFEAQPPFGPGIKCFLLWMMIGFAFSQPFIKNNKVFH